MSVSGELLCSFELLKPLDSSALKSHIKKSRNKRQNMLNSPVRPATDGTLSTVLDLSHPNIIVHTDLPLACTLRSSKLLTVCAL